MRGEEKVRGGGGGNVKVKWWRGVNVKVLKRTIARIADFLGCQASDMAVSPWPTEVIGWAITCCVAEP